MNNILEYVLTFLFLESVFRVTTPILFATLGSVVAERAGTPNIALEAIMLFSALFGALGSGLTENLYVGIVCAIAGGLLTTSLLIVFALNLKADIILTGIALNLLAVGGTVFMMYSIIGDKGTTSSIKTQVFPNAEIPFIANIPILGDIVNGHNFLTYVAFLMVFLLWFLLFKTKIGLHIRSVGENKGAAESVGINSYKTQVIALLTSGFLASLGGAFMSMGYINGFAQNMISGRGFIALAAASMGKLHPIYAMFAALVFGTADAFSNVMATMQIPDELVKLIPYATTIIGLVMFSIIETKRKANKTKNSV